MTDEQRELMRICAARVVDNSACGRVVDPRTLEWANWIVRFTPPLGRPLGTGEPAKIESMEAA